MGVDYKYLDYIRNPINNITCLMFVYHEKFEHVFIFLKNGYWKL